MNSCKTCKYWVEVGKSVSEVAGIDLSSPLGACTSVQAIDGVVRTEQEDSFFALQVIIGQSTGLYTKEDFGCKYYEPSS